MLDQLLRGLSPEEVMGREGLMQELQRHIMERMLEGELTAHLGYEKHAPEGRKSSNSRDGRSRKRVKTGRAEVEIEVPRDREGSFEPALAVYPIVFLAAIHVKGRVQGHIQTQAVYLALALTLTGEKELLGLWVGEAEGARYWLSILTEVKNRGVQGILIAAGDGLNGFPEAIATVFPRTQVEALNAQLRKVTKKRGTFLTPNAVKEVMYLALQRASRKWTRSIHDGSTALNHLAPVLVPV